LVVLGAIHLRNTTRSPNSPSSKPRREGDANAWLFQAPPGLADVLKKEMVFVGALERKQDLLIKRQRNHDLLFANRLKSDEGLSRLRVAEAVFRCPVFGRYKISKRQLQTIAEALKPLGPKRLVVQVAGRQFDRRDLSRWLEKELGELDYQFTDNEEASEVWMFCIDEAYYFGIPLMKARQTVGRDDRTEEREGSLPPPIAAALAFAGMPKNDDVILDPVCGSGTLLAEALFYATEAERIGIDIDPKAVAIARANLGAGSTTAKVTLLNKDATRSGLDRKDISLVLANLPFGLQFGDRKDNPRLYRGILDEMLRLARPDRFRAVLLTSDIESLRAALKDLKGYDTQDLFRVKIRGELATALLLKRR
jgi:hypothetical protein